MARPGQRFDLLGSGSALGAPLEGGVAVLVIQVDAEVCGLGALHLNSPSQLVLRPVFGPGNLISKIIFFNLWRQSTIGVLQNRAKNGLTYPILDFGRVAPFASPIRFESPGLLHDPYPLPAVNPIDP